MPGSEQKAKRSSSEVFVCQICTTEAHDRLVRPCSDAHPYCLACWRTYAQTRATAADIPCMNPYCKFKLTEDELHRLGVEPDDGSWKCLASTSRRRRGGGVAEGMCDLSLEWAREHLRLCPRCLVPIEKNGTQLATQTLDSQISAFAAPLLVC